MSTNFTDKSEGLYFVTCTIVDWIDIFTKPVYCNIIIESLKYCQNYKNLTLKAYVIMPNHIHLILETENIGDLMRDFKKFTSKKIFEELKNDNRKYILELLEFEGKKIGQNFQVWQRDFYPEIIETEKFFLEKLNYIHQNPVRKIFVSKPEDWLCSSARNYFLNDHELINVSVGN